MDIIGECELLLIVRVKKYLIVTFIKINYSQVKTTNLKVPLFIVASSTVLIEYKIFFNSKKETTKVAMSKLWPVYCISSMQICLFSTRQII